MSDWDLTPPPPSELGDREVPLLGDELVGRRVALMVCGGIAAMKTPLIARALRKRGAEVQAFVSRQALRYVTEDALEWSTTQPVVRRLSARAEHLSGRRSFDAYLLPQATYNTINKLACGIADGVVTTTLASALGRLARGQTQILLTPAMHGSMHNAILTDSLAKLRRLGVTLVAPREAYGKHNVPDEEVLVLAVCRALAPPALAGRRVLVTGGPTPVPIDNVRRITTRFRGKLSIAIAETLLRRGADPLLVHGDGAYPPPPWLPHRVVHTYDDYRSEVHRLLRQGGWSAGIFAAAVADYRPRQVLPGKTPSGRTLDLQLVPTAKVIDEVRDEHPELLMITFKYQEGVSHDELIAIARQRLDRYQVVIANRGEEMGAGDEHVAWLVTGDQPPQRLEGKPGIARGIAAYLEELWSRP
ncbi:MAG: phosphopantothenoylcysteine decarboxylase [Acidobacteria bacterium]|nr:MAG: phosphopantothenoylcysteine decarboxylase [Acidobacteriota bacterium]